MRGQYFGEEYKEVDFKLFKRLLNFLKPYKKYVYLAISLTIITSALGPLRPYLTKIAVDDYIANNDWNGLINITAMIFGALILQAAFQFSYSYLMQWIAQKALYDIRIKIFRHIGSLAMRYFDKNPIGRLVTRVTNDVEALNQMFSAGIVMIIADILMIIFILIFMLSINWQLTLLTLIVLPIMLLAIKLFKDKVRVLFRDIRAEVSAMNSFLSEFVSGISTVKLFTREDSQRQGFDNINLRTRDLHVRTIFYYAIFYPVVEMIGAIGLAIIIWYSAGHILSGAMTIGVLIAFMQYAEMFFRPIRDLSEKYTTLQNAMASSERIFETLDNDETVKDTGNLETEPLKKAIEFRNLTFSYDGESDVLKDISFKANKGETLAIVGATGSGKTTLINLIMRFYDYNRGEILYDGIDLHNFKAKSIRSRIALVMQDVFLFSGNVADNISLGAEEISMEKIKSAADSLGARHFIERLPDKYFSDVSERGIGLSSGQRQLISFCRAFARDPEILILDEATSNVDSETERIIEQSLSKLFSGRTSIVIAHRLSTIKRADRIIVLHKGLLREVGTHEELLKNRGIYYRLYNLQFKEKEPVV